MLQILIFQVGWYQNVLCCILIKTMRIYSLPNYNINSKIAFRATNPNSKKQFNDKKKDQNSNNKPLPEWARKAMLFSVVFLAFKNDPTVQNFLHPYEPTQEDIDKTEFLHDYGKLIKEKGVSTAFYQLSRLDDIEQPKVKALGKNNYSLEFELDKQKVIMEMALDKNNKDTIRGRVKLGDRKFVNYTAVFPDENKDEFKILIKDKNTKYVFGRDYFGELYQVREGKKVQLNKKNVQRYEEYQEMLDELDDWKFFTNENDFWRKANIVLIIFLLLNEMVHDNVKRKIKRIENSMKEEDKELYDLFQQLKNNDITPENAEKIVNKIIKKLEEQTTSNDTDAKKEDRQDKEKTD